MKKLFSYFTHQIHPEAGITDCPILNSQSSNKNIAVEIPITVNKINDAWYAFGSIACDKCVHKCTDAKLVVSKEYVQNSSDFEVSETPVEIGVRLQAGNIEALAKSSANETNLSFSINPGSVVKGFLSTKEREMSQIVDDIIELHNPSILTMGPNGDFGKRPYLEEF